MLPVLDREVVVVGDEGSNGSKWEGAMLLLLPRRLLLVVGTRGGGGDILHHKIDTALVPKIVHVRGRSGQVDSPATPNDRRRSIGGQEGQVTYHVPIIKEPPSHLNSAFRPWSVHRRWVVAFLVVAECRDQALVQVRRCRDKRGKRQK